MQSTPAPALPLPAHISFKSRQLFPHLQPDVFLNHAAISPPSSHVEAAIGAALRDFSQVGVGAVGAWVGQRERLRGKIASWIGGLPEEVGLVKTTSDGVLAVAQSLDWERGDVIVLCRGEFPTNITPWLMAAKQFELQVEWVDATSLAREEGIAALEALLQAGSVRLVALSAVQFQTGLRMPVGRVGALCRAYGAQLFVDAIQAVGVVPVDVRAQNIDYMAVGSHKWLMGVEGAGFVYIRQGLHEALVPRLASWLSHEDALTFLFEGPGELRYDRPVRRRADFVEKGALNVLGYAALEASLDLLMHLGAEALLGHAWGYVQQLEEALEEALGWQSVRQQHQGEPTAIYAVPKPVGLELEAFSAQASAHGVSLSTPDGHIRMAPHWPNDPEQEIPKVVATLRAILK